MDDRLVLVGVDDPRHACAPALARLRRAAIVIKECRCSEIDTSNNQSTTPAAIIGEARGVRQREHGSG